MQEKGYCSEIQYLLLTLLGDRQALWKVLGPWENRCDYAYRKFCLDYGTLKYGSELPSSQGIKELWLPQFSLSDEKC